VVKWEEEVADLSPLSPSPLSISHSVSISFVRSPSIFPPIGGAMTTTEDTVTTAPSSPLLSKTKNQQEQARKAPNSIGAGRTGPGSRAAMEKYELLKDIGSGNFGVARLMRNRETKELVAMKYIPRGLKIDENVAREIINHRSLRHPNIIRFKEVVLTPTHLAIVMEYAAGGELFDRICSAGRFSEDESRYFFQQLICGVSYCHFMQICHRDLKLENTLLDGSPAPRLKICDFGYSKSSLLHSKPKSTVGTPAYIAPEVLSRREYDGKVSLSHLAPLACLSLQLCPGQLETLCLILFFSFLFWCVLNPCVILRHLNFTRKILISQGN
jgi:hypothetical protein